jgi:GWxTD domain-containing protein
MKPITTFASLKFIMLLVLFSFTSQLHALQSNFYLVPFYAPEEGPYVETYLTIMGYSTQFAESSIGKKRASIEVTYLFKQADQIKKFHKVVLLSPEIALSDSIFPNFMDISRIPLENGIYDLEVKIKDLNNENSLFSTTTIVRVDFPIGELSVSGLEWLERYQPSADDGPLVKSGYELVPYVSNFFPENISQLAFYQEMYNLSSLMGEQDQLLLKYYIESASTAKILQDFSRFQKIAPKKVNVILGKFDISNLPSGNYNLVIELVNRQNEALVSTRSFFQRSNPSVANPVYEAAVHDITSTFVTRINNIDTLSYYLDALYPISSQVEVQYALNAVKSNDLLKMQYYFYNFWSGKNTVNPEAEWLAYKKVLDQVNASYSTQVKKGYRTDRGRVYLQYGVPNIFVQEKHLNDSHPFEIWQYYELNGFKNVKFLFYNPHQNWNTFELLHSTLRSELQNENWLAQLYDYYNPISQIDNLKYNLKDLKQTDFGIRVLTIWNNP